MDKIELLEQEAMDNKLNIVGAVDLPMKVRGLLIGRDILIDKHLKKAERIVTLREEIDHYQMNVGNIIDILDLSKLKQELLARWSTYEKLLPYDMIISSIKSGVANVHEFAEYCELPEDFVVEAVNYYRQRYGEVNHKGYSIKFGKQLRLFKTNSDTIIKWTDEFGNSIDVDKSRILIKTMSGAETINRLDIKNVRIKGLNLIIQGHMNEILRIINIPCNQFDKALKICNLLRELYSFETYAAGVTKVNDDGLDIQELVKGYFNEHNFLEAGKLKLVQDPDNPYDKFAVKIIHDDLGHIGYVPAKHAVKVNSLIDKKNIHGIISQIDKRDGAPHYLQIIIKYS